MWNRKWYYWKNKGSGNAPGSPDSQMLWLYCTLDNHYQRAQDESQVSLRGSKGRTPGEMGQKGSRENNKSSDCKVQTKEKEGAKEKEAAVANQEP